MMVSRIKLTIILLILCLSIFRCEKDPVSPEDTETQIQKVMEANDIPSVAACIIKNGGIVWSFAHGSANFEQNVPATDETIYILASVSKLATATAVMQLCEQGLIDLDEDINHYLSFPVRNPHYPDEKITARMLLSHRSGLAWPQNEDPNFYQTYPGDSAPPLYPWIKEYIVPGGSQYVAAIWKNTAPGRQELYSNIGVALLGYLVEAVSGNDFNEYCKTHIFQPLDMPHTSFRLNDLDINQVAMPYQPGNKPYGHYSVKPYPSASLRSSISDFSHFIIAYINGGIYNGNRILQESTINEMLRPHYPDTRVGLIWMSYDGGWYGHGGGFHGTSTYVEFHKENQTGILIFSNGENNADNPLGLIHLLIRAEAGY